MKAQKKGDWMNGRNIKTNPAGLPGYTGGPSDADLATPKKYLNFKEYPRKSNNVDIGNELWIRWIA